MMVAAGAMPPVAEKTSGVKEPISISRTRCSYARLLRPSCCLYVEVRDDLQLLGARGDPYIKKCTLMPVTPESLCTNI